MLQWLDGLPADRGMLRQQKNLSGTGDLGKSAAFSSTPPLTQSPSLPQHHTVQPVVKEKVS